MRRVSVENGLWKDEDGRVLGREIGRIMTTRIIVENDDKEKVVLLIGGVNEKNEFEEICSNEGSPCGERCPFWTEQLQI